MLLGTEIETVGLIGLSGACTITVCKLFSLLEQVKPEVRHCGLSLLGRSVIVLPNEISSVEKDGS